MCGLRQQIGKGPLYAKTFSLGEREVANQRTTMLIGNRYVAPPLAS